MEIGIESLVVLALLLPSPELQKIACVSSHCIRLKIEKIFKLFHVHNKCKIDHLNIFP